MMTSKLYSTFFYFISVMFFFNYTSPFVFWIMTELNLVLFILFVMQLDLVKYKQEMNDLLMFYFIIQSVSSILILSDFFFSSEFHIFNSDVMFICSLLIKLGLFPFFFWVFKLSQYFGYNAMSYLLTLQKIPFFLGLFNSGSNLIPMILLFSFISGSILIFYSVDFIYMIVSSSLSSSYWIFYLYNYSLYFFLFYFMLYSSFIFLFLKMFFVNLNKSFDFLFLLMFFMFIFGLSPLSLFFFKLYTMFFLFFNYKIFESLLFWLFSFICLFGYMKFSFKVFFFKFEFYNSAMSFDMKKFFFSSSLFFFLLFLLY